MKHETFSDFFLWIFAFVFLIAGAALTSETVPGGMFVILGGSLLLPSFSQWSEKIVRVRFPFFVRVAGFIVFLLVGVWFSGERMRSDLELPMKTQIQMYR